MNPKRKRNKNSHDPPGITDGLDITINDDPEVCPYCGTHTIILDEEKCEEYCTTCGVITRAASRYVAGNKVDLPYGLIII